MARGAIKGLTVEVGGDTSSLEKALRNVDKDIRDTTADLKQVERLLKFDPSNTELLATKQRLLNEKVAETKQKLTELKKAQDDLVKNEGVEKNSSAYEELQNRISVAEAALKQATKEADSFNVSLASASASLNKVADGAQKVADKTKALSAAGAAVAAGIGAMAVKAMTAADELNTLAKQSGLTTAEIQKMQYASDLVDVSTDDIIGALTKMRKNMASTSTETQEAWKKLGISVKDSSGEYRDSTEVFYEALEALSNVRNETERDVIAMQLFGKNADQLAGIIDDGGAKLKALGDEAERTGKIWSQESIDAANAVNDMVDALKADVSQTILITGAKALEALQPVIEKVIEAISKVLDVIGQLDPSTIALIGTIALAVAAISPIASLIAGIAAAIANVLTILPMLTPVIAAVTAAAPWLALAACIGVIVGIIIDNWDLIKQKGQEFIDFVQNSIIQPWNDYWAGVKDRWNELWENISNRVRDNINMIIDFVNSGIDAINELINKINDSAVGKALGFNIGTVGTIPGLASGGTIGNGGAALVGEAGAELLTVNQGQATVTPLVQNINNYNGGSGGQPITVTVPLSINGKQFARAVYEDMSAEGLRRGGTMGAMI